MIRNSIVLAAFFAAVMFAATGCGGSASSAARQPSTESASPTALAEPTAPRTAAAGQETPGQTDQNAENKFAQSMLLTLADFPAGWVHKAADPSEDLQASAPDPIKRCISSTFAGQTGHAIGGEFSDKDTTILSINPSVYVFDNAADAQSAAQSIISEVQCFADVVGAGLDIDASFAFGKTYTEPLQPDAFGATAAIRSFNTQIYKDQQPPTSDVLVFDVVIVVHGRVLSEVDGFQRYSPIDQRLLKGYVDQARVKIRQEP